MLKPKFALNYPQKKCLVHFFVRPLIVIRYRGGAVGPPLFVHLLLRLITLCICDLGINLTKPYACYICEATFVQKTTYVSHLRKHKNKPEVIQYRATHESNITFRIKINPKISIHLMHSSLKVRNVCLSICLFVCYLTFVRCHN